MLRWWGDAIGENVSSVASSYLCALRIWGEDLPRGWHEGHKIFINRHPFYDPYAVARSLMQVYLEAAKGKALHREMGFIIFAWQLWKARVSWGARDWIAEKKQAQYPHLSVCVWCPMLVAGASSTAHGDLCRRRSEAHIARTGAGTLFCWLLWLSRNLMSVSYQICAQSSSAPLCLFQCPEKKSLSTYD